MKFRKLPELSNNLIEKFISKIQKPENPCDCWVWTGSINKDGYGTLSVHLAHRLSWLIHFEKEPSLYVLHKCDNPPCVNPNHLFLGNHTDNMKDMISKGRSRKGDKNPSRVYPNSRPRGEKVHGSILTENNIKEIRNYSSKYTKTVVETFALKFNVACRTIRDVINNVTWKHIEK